ncbi:MAG: hypothetical protein J0I98_09150 [Mesorhizobium sp.]|nr:hypothetical protein [Mesorhizobium sp.]MBN9242947.1 hypothetical protein [Mesorhizobium sp.]MBN9274036.1 hypothetical protein [Mesorhizobium sp.]
MRHRSARADEISPVHIYLTARSGGVAEIDLPCRDIEDALVAIDRLDGPDKRVVAISVQGYRIEPDEFAGLRQSLNHLRRPAALA